MRRGRAGMGGRGTCGGVRRRDGSGGGRGNRGTSKQPFSVKKTSFNGYGNTIMQNDNKMEHQQLFQITAALK